MESDVLVYTDGVTVPTFPPADEGPHRPADDPHWQESFLILWGDVAKDSGGLLRVGHSPHLNGGEMTVWAYAFTPNGLYGADIDFPKQDGDVLLDGQGAGTVARYRFDGENTHWTFAHDGVALDLVATDYHPPISLWRSQESNLAYPHSEAACGVSGRLTIGEETVEFNGMGMRDHSWGVRHWGKGKVHRWFNAAFGPDLSMCLLTMYSEGTDHIRRLGYVVRDGVVYYSEDVDIVVYMEPDGATHRGGVGRIRLDTGELLEFVAEPMTKGVYMSRHDRYLCQTMCKVSHAGRIGVGDFEITENCHAGTRAPAVLVNGIIENGVYARR
jgi:hypothetical protein